MDFRKVTPDSINYLKSAGIAEQAKLYIKLTKLHRLAAQNVWFNQQCKQSNFIPHYINIRSNTHSRSSSIALVKAKQIWLNEESRHWFSVRDNIKLHLKVLYSELSFNLHNVEFDVLDNKARELASRLVHDKYITQCRKLERLSRDSRSNSLEYSDNNFNSNHSFYPRVKNYSNVQFSPSEHSLLEKGLKYNIKTRLSQKSLETLVVDSEIACFKSKQDGAVKHQVAAHIKKAFNTSNNKNCSEIHIFRSLQNKINQNNLIITKADKGNSVVILDRTAYNQKVDDVIQGEDFECLSSDPTKHYITQVKDVIKSTSYVSPDQLKYKVPMNPRSPFLYGLPKTHKDNIPIRPVVSYIGAPTYDLAKYLNKILRSKASFNPQYSLKNSLQLIEKVQNINISPYSKLLSLDVDSLFTNVPYEDCLSILRSHFERQRLHPGEIYDLLNLTRVCMEQNYFRFNNRYYRQKEGLAMGSPLSPLMADIFMDHFERNNVVSEPNIQFYYRYVDDLIFCWTGTNRQINTFVNKLNSVHPKIKFKLELESNKSLNYLDLTITRVHNKLDFQIFRKPTHTDTIIPASSCHPLQQKLASFRSYVHRLMSVPLSTDNYIKELNIIYQIAISNGYSKQIIDNLIVNNQNKRVRSLLYACPPELINKYVGSLTYLGPISDKIANILRKNNIFITFRTDQNVRHLCNGKDSLENSKKSGVYKLLCNDCNGVYVGQTGRNFEIRYKEHVAAHRNGHPDKSHFAKHLIDTGHSLGNNNTYNILHVCNKSFRLCVLEQLEIMKHNNNNYTLLNDQTNLIPSPLLRLVTGVTSQPPSGGAI